MVRLTRRQSRSIPTTSEAPTPTTTPLFSNRTSIRSETPITSHEDECGIEKPLTRSRLSKKRAAACDSSDSEGEPPSRLSSKRRAISKTAYIEIPAGKSNVIIFLCLTLHTEIRFVSGDARERKRKRGH